MNKLACAGLVLIIISAISVYVVTRHDQVAPQASTLANETVTDENESRMIVGESQLSTGAESFEQNLVDKDSSMNETAMEISALIDSTEQAGKSTGTQETDFRTEIDNPVSIDSLNEIKILFPELTSEVEAYQLQLVEKNTLLARYQALSQQANDEVKLTHGDPINGSELAQLRRDILLAADELGHQGMVLNEQIRAAADVYEQQHF